MKDKLLEWKIVTDNNCPHCNKKDDIIHFITGCQKVIQFWKQLSSWGNNNFNLKIELLRNDIVESFLFGFSESDPIHKV